VNTPDHSQEIEVMLGAFASGVSQALEDNFLALYVFGSYAAGDFVPESSDIDFLGIAHRPLNATEAARLAALHRRLASNSPWGGRLEGGYAARHQIRDWGLEGSIAAVEPGRDFVPSVPSDYSADNMLALREHGRALVGPPPTDLIPPVSRQVLEGALRDYLADLLERPERAAPGSVASDAKLGEWLLNAARCLCGLRTGRVSTKAEAAVWLAGELPDLTPALETALAQRSNREAGRGTRARLLAAFAALRAAVPALLAMPATMARRGGLGSDA